MQPHRVQRRVPVHVSREGGKSQITAVLCDVSPDGVFIGTLHAFPVGSRVDIRPTDKSREFRAKGIVVQRSVAPAYMGDGQIPGMHVKVALSAEQQRDLERDRRPKNRVDLDTSAVAFVGGKRYSLELQNISTTGAALTSDSFLSVTELLLLSFTLPESSRGLAINCIVVRKQQLEKGALIAVEFLDPSEQVQAEIKRYVTRSRP